MCLPNMLTDEQRHAPDCDNSTVGQAKYRYIAARWDGSSGMGADLVSCDVAPQCWCQIGWRLHLTVVPVQLP